MFKLICQPDNHWNHRKDCREKWKSTLLLDQKLTLSSFSSYFQSGCWMFFLSQPVLQFVSTTAARRFCDTTENLPSLWVATINCQHWVSSLCKKQEVRNTATLPRREEKERCIPCAHMFTHLLFSTAEPFTPTAAFCLTRHHTKGCVCLCLWDPTSKCTPGAAIAHECSKLKMKMY